MLSPHQQEDHAMAFPQRDREVIQGLARQYAEIANSPELARRRQRWIEHNSLRSQYPMMLIFPEGSWQELLPESGLSCTDPEARKIEWQLRHRLYTHAHFADDSVTDPVWEVGKCIRDTGWGLEARRIDSDMATGAWHFDPVIKTPADLKRLRFPELIHDAAESQRRLTLAADLLGDTLPVRLVGQKHISYHLMAQYTRLRGLEEVMTDMYAEPDMLHAAMAFFEEGHRRLLRQYLDANLLDFNNDNTYHNSGGNGFTDELPRPGADPARPRPGDLWASAEAQEMALVSPEHHAEFILQYEKRLLAPFGLTGYGCCEDLTRKLDLVLTIPHIRRISISPWADVAVCAERLRGQAIFSWKPNPAHLVGSFHPAAIRDYVRHTVQVTRQHGCFLEIILKDTHTCEQHPERFDEWSRIAREVITAEYGTPGAH